MCYRSFNSYAVFIFYLTVLRFYAVLKILIIQNYNVKNLSCMPSTVMETKAWR